MWTTEITPHLRTHRTGKMRAGRVAAMEGDMGQTAQHSLRAVPKDRASCLNVLQAQGINLLRQPLPRFLILPLTSWTRKEINHRSRTKRSHILLLLPWGKKRIESKSRFSKENVYDCLQQCWREKGDIMCYICECGIRRLRNSITSVWMCVWTCSCVWATVCLLQILHFSSPIPNFFFSRQF